MTHGRAAFRRRRGLDALQRAAEYDQAVADEWALIRIEPEKWPMQLRGAMSVVGVGRAQPDRGLFSGWLDNQPESARAELQRLLS